MPSSLNKGYTLQTVGSNAGTWGTDLNDNMIKIADLNIGGTYSLAIGSPSGVAPNGTFTVSSPNNQNAILVLSGSPSYATWTNITITVNDLNGFLFVDNKITLPGGQTVYPEVRIKNSANATYAVVPPNSRASLISDGTNGVRTAGVAGVDGFASGTSTLFFNASAPLNWTKSTTHNNKALRIVNTSGGGSGGSTDFTSIFAARTITTSNLPNFNVTITDPGHNHSYDKYGYQVDYGGTGAATNDDGRYTSTATNTKTTGITAAFGNTARGGAQTTIDFAVQYVDAIICTKAY